MCSVEKVKEPYEISSMLVQTLGFRAKCDIAALHFLRVKIYKGKGKAFNHRASTVFTGSVLVCTLSSCHAVFSSFQVCHAPACCSLFGHHSWSFLRDGSHQGPQVLNGVIESVHLSEEYSFFLGAEMCHFLLFWVQRAYPDQQWRWSLRTCQSARSEISFGITIWLYASWNIISVK